MSKKKEKKSEDQVKLPKVENPYGKTSKVNAETEGYVEGKLGKTIKDTGNITDATIDKAKKNYKEQLTTSKSELDENNGVNIAKTGGQYGTINDKDFSDTLQLMRDVDRYNNKPQDHIVRIGPKGQLQDLGTGYTRPEVNTMETRAMNEALSLDTNQKQLAQALQDAVNHKDLEAFQTLWKQIYGVDLSRQDAALKMLEFTRQLETQNILTKDQTQFNAEFGRFFTSDSLQVLYNLSSEPGNYMWSQMLADSLYSTTPPSLSEQGAQQLRDAAVELCTEKARRGEIKPGQIYEYAEQITDQTLHDMANMRARNIKVSQGPKAKMRAVSNARDVRKSEGSI